MRNKTKVTAMMLIGCLDPDRNKYEISKALHGWRIFNRARDIDIIVNENDFDVEYSKVESMADDLRIYEAQVIRDVLYDGIINLRKLTELVYNNSDGCNIKDSRISTSYQIKRETNEVDKQFDYSFIFPTDEAICTHRVQHSSVTINSSAYTVVINHLNTYLEENYMFNLKLQCGKRNFDPLTYGVKSTPTLVTDVYNVLKTKFPDISHELEIEDDIHTLHIGNISFEVSPFQNMNYVDMFGKYELCSISNIDGIIRFTKNALLIFINCSNSINYS